LSALFGAIANSLRPVNVPPAAPQRATTPRSADKAKADKARTDKAKTASSNPKSKQTAAQRDHQAGKAKAAKDAPRNGPKVSAVNPSKPVQRPVKPAAADQPLPKPARAERSLVAVGLSPDSLARLSAQGFRAEMKTKGILASVVRLIPPRGMSLGEAQRKVRMADASATADFDHYYYTDEGPGCTGPSCEPISLIGWNAPASRQCGPVPTIGLIDTGVDPDHEALRGQSIDVLPAPQRRGEPSQRDHGTAMAALLIGRSGSATPGLLPGAHVLAVDAFYRDGGTADRTDVTTLVLALEALAERNVRVVNMSLSGPPNEVLRKAIASAQERGMVIVAAAGNNGAGAEPSYPAAYPGVIAVTAVDRKLDVYRRATQGEYVDLAAPGVDLWVAAPGGGGTMKTGTSYAVPFISAAAAILRASNSTLDGAGLQALLERRTLDLGKPGRDKTYGSGLLQAADLCPPSRNEMPVAQSATGLGTETP